MDARMHHKMECKEIAHKIIDLIMNMIYKMGRYHFPEEFRKYLLTKKNNIPALINSALWMCENIVKKFIEEKKHGSIQKKFPDWKKRRNCMDI